MTTDPHNRESVEMFIDAPGGSEVETLLRAYENHPDWRDPHGIVWTAVFDARACPTCLVLDGHRYKVGEPGPNFDGYSKISPHEECRCYLLPWKWRNEFMQGPNGAEPARRPATGDNGEEALPFSVTAEQWLRANPKTAAMILGKEIASAFLGRSANGPPLPPIPLEWAEQRWKAQLEKALQPMKIYEERLSKAKELYWKREDPEMLEQAIEAFESCMPLIRSALDSYRQYDIARGKDDDGRWGEAFQQLAIIYEKQKRFSDALAVCREALDVGWGGDWEHRMARLQKRMSKSKKN